MQKHADRPGLPVVARRLPLPESGRRKYADGVKRIQNQQILIAGEDRVARPGQCRRQDGIVVAVATGRRIEGAWRNERERPGKQLKSAPHIDGPLPELPLESSRNSSSSACDEMTTCWRTPCSSRSLHVPRATSAATSTFVSRSSLTRRA